MATLGKYQGDGVTSGYVYNWMEYSISRAKTSYTITFNIKFQRVNTYSGTPTQGNVTAYFRLNGADIKNSGSKNFTVPNNKSIVTLFSGTHTVNLGEFNSASITVGYRCTRSSGSDHLQVSNKTSGSITVNPYTTATKCGMPTKAYRTPSGDAGVGVPQKITWEGQTGGTNNSIVGYNFRYRKDGATSWVGTYSTSSPTYTFTPTSTGAWDYQIQVKGSAGSAYYSDWKGFTFNAITPVKLSTPSMKSTSNGKTFFGNLQGGDGFVTVEWNGVSDAAGNDVTGYDVQACYPGGTFYSKGIFTGTSAKLQFDGYKDAVCPIQVRVIARGDAPSAYYSNPSASITVYGLNPDVNIYNGEWKPGKAYLYINGSWKRAKNIYIYNGTSWVKGISSL